MDAGDITHRTVSVNGINMHIAEKGDGPVILFLHGFPELWYTWRHQILSLAARGYHAVAPDLRGYGDTDAPPAAASYSMLHIVGDLVALIEELGQDREPGEAEAEFARLGSALVLRKSLTYRTPGPLFMPKEGWDLPDAQIPLPSWLSEEDINYYASKFEKSGFTGALYYYRALDLNWELMAPWTGQRIMVPTKFIVGDLDLTYHLPMVQEYINNGGFKHDVPFLEEVVVMKGVGHFIQEEKPDEITDHIYNFIKNF